jgi:hypothetical protein
MVDSNPRSSVFLASSSEVLLVAEAAKAHLEAEAEVDIWSDNVFRLNRAYLNTLLDRSGFYDYAVVIMTPDDELTIRGDKEQTARDNVIFEYGLFLGRLGPDRAFVLKEESVRVFTDIAKIEVSTFEAGADLKASTRSACDRILSIMRENEAAYDIGFLPSTALALGYYHNFLGCLIDGLLAGRALRVEDREGGKTIAYEQKSIHLNILLPRSLSELGERQLRSKTRHLRQVTLQTDFRPFPFCIEGDLTPGTVTLFDIPTTLRASSYAIGEAFSRRFLRETRQRIEQQEIRNFEKTLLLVVPDPLEGITVSVGDL